MLWRAERLYIDGSLRAGLDLQIDDSGRITALLPQVADIPPTHLFAQQMLVPALAHACALPVFAAALAAPPTGPAHGALAQWTWLARCYRQWPPERLAAALKASLRALAGAGMGCVGVPVLPGPRDAAAEPKGAVWQGLYPPTFLPQSGMLDLVCEVAREVGLRTALLLPFGDLQATAPMSASTFEHALQAFDHSVQHILRYDDPKLSWALLLPNLAHLNEELMVALRLRLGHIPLLVADAGGQLKAMTVSPRSASPQLDEDTVGQSPAAAADEGGALLAQLGRLGCLDAGVTLLCAQHAAKVALPSAAALSAASGAKVLALGRRLEQRLKGECQHGQALASSLPNLAGRAAGDHQSALGLRRSALWPQAWADLLAVPWHDDRAALAWLSRWQQHPSSLAAHPYQLFVGATWVGGQAASAGNPPGH